MTQDIGHWKQIRGHAKQWWAELTDDDLDEICGRREKLAGAIQKRYGRSREEAEVDINHFIIRTANLLRLK